MFFRSVMFIFICLAVSIVGGLWDSVADPVISARIGVAQTQDSEIAAGLVRTYSSGYGLSWWVSFFIVLFAFFCCFGTPISRLLKSTPKSSVVGLLAIGLLMGGCRKYEVPEYVTVETNETAFVVPLEGDIGEQDKFDSAEKLNELKVATKRIRLTKRWDQTGRIYFSGDWIPTIRVIKVDRSPVTQSWDKDSNNGIWVESNDSVGFSTGFSVTAFVEEPDTALFLYKYKGDSLEEVMNTEIRARVQSIAAEVAARYDMDDLRSKKRELIDEIKSDVVPFFEDRGITISTIGMFGGFEYENPEIQSAIENVFIAQQEKEVAAAQLAAQADKNARLKMEGEGQADKVREIAIGDKDAAITRAEGESQAIQMIAEATSRASENPTFLAVKTLEVQSEQIERWDGHYPQFMMSGGQSPALLLQLPSQAAAGGR